MNTSIIQEVVCIRKEMSAVQLRISAVLLRKTGRWTTLYAGLESGASSFTRTQVFDREVKDDRLLYQRLCDEDRADYLEEQFHKKNSTNQ